MNSRNQLAVGKGALGQSVYRIEISPAADRDLVKLKGRIRMRDFERLRSTVRSLAENPRPRAVRKIRGTEKSYRIRVGSYRVVYDVYDSHNLVLILQVARRSETTYRQLP
jgi:mRNA interferase RelE/StbE